MARSTSSSSRNLESTNVVGEGTGSKQVTDAADAELHKLSADDIHSLIAQAERNDSQQ